MTKFFLKKIADYENRATGEHIERYRFAKRRGNMHEIDVRPSEAFDTKTFKMKLQNLGAALPASADQFIKEAVSKDPTHWLVHEKRTGWLPNSKGFVLADGFIGDSTEKIRGIYIPQRSTLERTVKRAGTIKGWRNSVGQAAQSSSAMMTAICTAFAAPLVGTHGGRPFTLCFSGQSNSGKTTAILAAASVVGYGIPDDLNSWNLTNAQLEERLPLFNDSLFPIDDLQVIGGAHKHRYQRIHDLAYGIAQGQTKGRHSSFKVERIADGRWRPLILTSSEVTIASLAAKTLESRSGGATHRFIDIPIATDAGGQIFDMTSKARKETWRDAQFKKIYEGCKKNHGAVFERYISDLIKFEKNRDEYIENRLSYFESTVRARADNGMVRKVANAFGLLYAGGMLARKFGIIDWSKRKLLKALKKTYFATVGIMPPSTDETLNDGKRKLRTFLKKLPTRIEWQKSGSDAPGYKERGKEVTYVVMRDQMHRLFASPVQRKLVVDWLLNTGQLKSSTTAASLRAKNQVIWPDGKRRRSYTVFLRSSKATQN